MNVFGLRLLAPFLLAEFVSGTHETVFLPDANECHVELLQHVLGDLQGFVPWNTQSRRLHFQRK